ncbi:Myosin heavy chain kinase A [Diplonema papillatum]|nr:Myosin heavy chain kinase A [Diplonema papillatum]
MSTARSESARGASPGGESQRTIMAERLFELPGHRVREMNENQKRVQRMKLEKKFMQEVSQGKSYRLGDYHRLQEDELLKIANKPLLTPPRAQPKKKVERDFDPIKVINEFSGSIRCLEITQGGATLWTGDNDGTISIRNGMTGEIVHHIRATGGLYVDSLFATDTHTWVGMNDGTVRIYDHLVYILVSEAQYHRGSVSCFTSTFDGKVFSASTDASIVKWDTEANSFALMSKLCGPSTEMIRCLACYGYNLFSGGDDKVIRCMDTEAGSGQEVREFIGHTDAVNALLVQDGYLFSGSKDNTIRAWNMEHGECIWVVGTGGSVVHQSPVTALIGDVVAHRFWSADASGVMHVWESTPENDFKHVLTLKDHEGPPIISLRSFCTIDAVKIWSLAANGKNRVWYSAVNKMEDAVQSTIDAMESIIQSDLIELAKWRELIKKLEEIDFKRKTKLAAALNVTCEWAVLAMVNQKWQRLVVVNKQKRRREKIATMLAKADVNRILYAYYMKLDRFLTERKNYRRKMAMARSLVVQNDRSLQMLYWKKMYCYAMVCKRNEVIMRMAECLQAHSTDGLRRVYWRKWRRHMDIVATRKKKNAIAANLARLSDKQLLQNYYFKLRAYRLVKAKKSRKLQAASVFAALTERGNMMSFFRKWKLFHRERTQQKRRGVMMGILGAKYDRSLLQRYFTTLFLFFKDESREKLRRKIALEEEENKDLNAKYEAKKQVLERLKVLDNKRKEIQAALDKRNLQKSRTDSAEADLRKLEAALEKKLSGQEERVEKAKVDMIDDVMALLKAKCLNYHLDHTLIQKIRDQTKQLPVTKIFLEAHMCIKRVVIDVTRSNQVAGERWKGLERNLDSIPDHHKSTILHAVKTMIVCYDLMSNSTKESLETDEEILNNTDYLEKLVNIAVRHRDSKLGRAAYRVK